MNNKNILIIGYGVVGHNLAKELEKLNPDQTTGGGGSGSSPAS